MPQEHPLIRKALQELRIDTPYYTAIIEPGATGVVLHLYGGRVVRWQIPAAAPASRSPRRRVSRRERQT